MFSRTVQSSTHFSRELAPHTTAGWAVVVFLLLDLPVTATVRPVSVISPFFLLLLSSFLRFWSLTRGSFAFAKNLSDWSTSEEKVGSKISKIWFGPLELNILLEIFEDLILFFFLPKNKNFLEKFYKMSSFSTLKFFLKSCNHVFGGDIYFCEMNIIFNIYILDTIDGSATSKLGIMMGTPPILIETGDSFDFFFRGVDIFIRSEIMMIEVIFFIMFLLQVSNVFSADN